MVCFYYCFLTSDLENISATLTRLMKVCAKFHLIFLHSLEISSTSYFTRPPVYYKFYLSHSSYLFSNISVHHAHYHHFYPSSSLHSFISHLTLTFYPPLWFHRFCDYLNGFAWNASAYTNYEKGVCPSVCLYVRPSVKRVICDKT